MEYCLIATGPGRTQPSEAGEQGQGTAWGKHVADAEYNEPATGG